LAAIVVKADFFVAAMTIDRAKPCTRAGDRKVAALD
jgi:hypothetical protein